MLALLFCMRLLYVKLFEVCSSAGVLCTCMVCPVVSRCWAVRTCTPNHVSSCHPCSMKYVILQHASQHVVVCRILWGSAGPYRLFISSLAHRLILG